MCYITTFLPYNWVIIITWFFSYELVARGKTHAGPWSSAKWIKEHIFTDWFEIKKHIKNIRSFWNTDIHIHICISYYEELPWRRNWQKETWKDGIQKGLFLTSTLLIFQVFFKMALVLWEWFYTLILWEWSSQIHQIRFRKLLFNWAKKKKVWTSLLKCTLQQLFLYPKSYCCTTLMQGRLQCSKLQNAELVCSAHGKIPFYLLSSLWDKLKLDNNDLPKITHKQGCH